MAKPLSNLAKRVTKVQIARRFMLCGLFCLLLFVPLPLPSQMVVPAEKVLDAVGVKPGMIISEIGAGRGIFTIPLAARVGEKGRIYANDIYQPALDSLRERCQKDGLKNIEIIFSKVDDPLFPKAALDMVFIVRTYHHLSEPVALLKNTISSLKPNAIIVIVDPDPVKGTTGPIRLSRSELTPPEKVRREAVEAGFEIADILTFLETHNIFILKVKN